MNMTLSECAANIICILLTIVCVLLIAIIILIMKKNKKTKEASFKNNFIIDIPKEKSAEDAPPLFIVSSDKQRWVIGVFDGMGGSGSSRYKENEEIRTGAYIASREVKNAVELFFNSRFGTGNFSFVQSDVESLKEKIMEKLKEKLDKQQYEKSSIRSSLVRTFPTTVAVALISVSNAIVKIKTLWAGDSRVYCLSAEKGLVQLTKDDLKVENDPFQNIKNDSPLSNMVNLDSDFSINFKEIEENTPAVFFAATDGCFQFFSTPMHFENMLLQTMQNANSMSEWEQKISEILKNISGDDCSISLLCLTDSNTDFVNFKELFRTRNESLYLDYMKDIDDKEKSIRDLKKQQDQTERFVLLETERTELYEELWSRYKKTNYSLFNTNEICEQVKQ
ncbi:hypothetical protein FACS189411_09550 [Bacteroidia bacterium]|nr:hypothetical protein FACS189411_09550 [Bacteroidia bacterium]